MLKQPRGLSGRRKLQAIIDAACRIVLAEGLDQAKMNAIATEAGVSTATVYSYFPSKDELFRAVVEKVAGNIEAELMEALHTPDGDPIEKMAMSIMGRLNDPDLRAMFRIMGKQGRRFPDALAVFDQHTRLRAHQSAVALFEKLAAEGRFVAGMAETASRQLLGMLEHETLILSTFLGNDGPGPRSAEEIVAETVKTLRARFGAEPAAV